MIELLVSIGILGVVMGGVYSLYTAQMQHTIREYRVAEGEMELNIAKNILERDLIMAGYGLADDYSAAPGGFAPKAIAATNGLPDTLTLKGTALGIEAREAQGWSYISGVSGVPLIPTFATWGDGREDLKNGDKVIVMEPGSKKLLTEGTVWLFGYQNSTSNFNPPLGIPSQGMLVYGVDRNATVPYATVAYSLGNPAGVSTAASCASGSQSFLRTEYWTLTSTASDTIPLETCVLDLQVTFGLDTDENGGIDFWDEGGAATSLYDASSIRKRLKQVRLYLLVQTGNRDRNYTYPAVTVRVGDSFLGTGGDFTLSAEQRKFRWKVISLIATPRNIR